MLDRVKFGKDSCNRLQFSHFIDCDPLKQHWEFGIKREMEKKSCIKFC